LVASKELLEFVLATAKKGLNIQRYKGLGEMNPPPALEDHDGSEKRTPTEKSLNA
jgi:DNA gyrase/topoisomerase IV subunit B